MYHLSTIHASEIVQPDPPAPRRQTGNFEQKNACLITNLMKGASAEHENLRSLQNVLGNQWTKDPSRKLLQTMQRQDGHICIFDRFLRDQLDKKSQKSLDLKFVDGSKSIIIEPEL